MTDEEYSKALIFVSPIYEGIFDPGEPHNLDTLDKEDTFFEWLEEHLVYDWENDNYLFIHESELVCKVRCRIEETNEFNLFARDPPDKYRREIQVTLLESSRLHSDLENALKERRYKSDIGEDEYEDE